MTTKHSLLLSLLSLLFFLLHHSQAQDPAPNTTAYTCSAIAATYPCHTYAFYRTHAPNFLDLGSIGDLFSVSPLQIANPSNITFTNTTLAPNQPLFVPLSCSCNTVVSNLVPNPNASLSYADFNPSPNSTSTISYATIRYTIRGGDTLYLLSTISFQNLTTYQSVEAVNPDLVPTNLAIGANAFFPVFCKCPNRNQPSFLISYVIQPEDNLTSVASFFGSSTNSIVEVNGNGFEPYTTIFIPVSTLPVLSQIVTPVSSTESFSLYCDEL